MATTPHYAVAVSTSESPDMQALGLSHAHLRDATAEVALHLMASGARLAYGGDLRPDGFTDLLFELVLRYGRRGDPHDHDSRRVTNYLAWPVHITLTADTLSDISSQLAGSGDLVCLTIDGRHLSPQAWPSRPVHDPGPEEWATGLTAMRRVMREATTARIVMGGRVSDYMGDMPGIAEEALLSLQARQPLFLIGGFGGCTRDIAETIVLRRPAVRHWRRRHEFEAFSASDLANGLSAEENETLAVTPHIDQAVALVLRGMHRLHLAE